MSEDERDREIRELRARLDALQGQPAPPVPPAPPTPPTPIKKSGGIGCAVAVVAVIATVSYCSQQNGSSSDPYSSLADTAPTLWSPPEGFERHETSRGVGVGVQWEKPTRAECRGSGVTCFAVNVVTEQSCNRSLYASITLLNAAGNNIGWTNDTAQGVQAGETVRLVFDTYERGVETARIAELNCY